MSRVEINWRPVSGDQEHDETWDSLPAFLAWADREGIHGSYTAYREDDEGELVVFDRGEF